LIWRFIAGTTTAEALPPPSLPEVAFAGRSNVGKSSLINALTGHNTLARVSHTPGRTQQINFFDLGGRLMLVDLPGYGFAAVGREQSGAWTRLITLYLKGRTSLRRLCLLVDGRHGLKESDRATMTELDRAALSYQIVLTKADKVTEGGLASLKRAITAELARHPAAHPEIIATSAHKGEGMAELRIAGGGGRVRSTRAFNPHPFEIECAPMSQVRDFSETKHWLRTARTLEEALPYMQRYAGKTFVIKYGGHAMVDDEIARVFARDIVLIKQVGINPIVVHGGGPQIAEMLDRLQIKSSFVDGLRVTDAATVEVVEMVLAGKTNKQIVSAICQAGGSALGLSGKDAGLMLASRVQMTKNGQTIDLGFVGDPWTSMPMCCAAWLRPASFR
jgi:GTP-binding protein